MTLLQQCDLIKTYLDWSKQMLSGNRWTSIIVPEGTRLLFQHIDFAYVTIEQMLRKTPQRSAFRQKGLAKLLSCLFPRTLGEVVESSKQLPTAWLETFSGLPAEIKGRCLHHLSAAARSERVLGWSKLNNLDVLDELPLNSVILSIFHLDANEGLPCKTESLTTWSDWFDRHLRGDMHPDILYELTITRDDASEIPKSHPSTAEAALSPYVVALLFMRLPGWMQLSVFECLTWKVQHTLFVVLLCIYMSPHSIVQLRTRGK